MWDPEMSEQLVFLTKSLAEITPTGAWCGGPRSPQRSIVPREQTRSGV
jgi:hypothetical protein